VSHARQEIGDDVARQLRVLLEAPQPDERAIEESHRPGRGMQNRSVTSSVSESMKLNRLLIIGATLVVALLGAALAGVVAHASAKTKVITVKEREYRLILSTPKSAVGPTQFVVRNTGKLAHALAISGPGLKTVKTKTIKPGASATLTVTLKSGVYSLYCPMPGHAARGMKATVTVPASAAGGGGGTATTTTSDTTTDDGGGAAWG
jgi:plastocyanin